MTQSPLTGTRGELLAYLEKATRQISDDSLQTFTTSSIARALSLSRNLTSQYLNDLVRERSVVKIGLRPVLFFHRAGLERYVGAKIPLASYSSLEVLFASTGGTRKKNFRKLVGCDQSLSEIVEQCKAAMEYPPNGLPVLCVGPAGTGKFSLAKACLEYCREEGILSENSVLTEIDGARYADDLDAVVNAVTQDSLVYVSNVELLSGRACDAVLTRALREGVTPGCAHPNRYVFSASSDALEGRAAELSKKIPMTILVPLLSDRPYVEREELALHFLQHESTRLGHEVAIREGALRNLAEAEYDSNVDGMKMAVASCCAEAYLHRKGEEVIIERYHLPASVLASRPKTGMVGTEELLRVGSVELGSKANPLVKALESVVAPLMQAVAQGDVVQGLADALTGLEDYEDCLLFRLLPDTPRARSYEAVLIGVFETVGTEYGIELSRRHARVLARQICVQQWPGRDYSSWKISNAERVRSCCAFVGHEYPVAMRVARRITEEVLSALGIKIDDLGLCLLSLSINEEMGELVARRTACVILCHGYSTATSIADAANRMLHHRIFESIDMRYDESVSDVMVPLKRLVSKYARCENVLLLVDMGSLGEAFSALELPRSVNIGIINSVSTPLALEIGAATLGPFDIEEVLAGAAKTCSCHYQVTRAESSREVVLFCSESGVSAAEKIRLLMERSLPADTGLETRAVDFTALKREGLSGATTSGMQVRAIIGTMDPGVGDVPFIGLDQVIASKPDNELDAVFSRYLTREALEQFHESLLENLTLYNVIEAITILNPERLLGDIQRAVRNLETATSNKIDRELMAGLLVHLCCLVERLVTRTAIAEYRDVEGFAAANEEFIDAFRSSFSDISRRYRVEFPVSEIAYAYDYVHAKRASGGRYVPPAAQGGLEDE